MKKLKHIAVWIIISLVIQLSILYYLDSYYLKPEKTFQAKKVDQKVLKKQDIVIKLPADFTQFDVSYDGNFVAYMSNGNVNVVNTKNGQQKTVSADKGNIISMYKWLCDRERLFIAEKPQTSDDENLVLNYYDASKDVKDKIENITYSDTKSEVKDIEVAPMTNVIYMKVSRSESRSEIYRSNAMNEIKKNRTVTSIIGDIKTLKHKDEFIYEDSNRNRVYSSSDNDQIIIKGAASTVLVGVDGSDNVYIGNLVNGKVDKIFYGSLNDATEKWQCINIDKSCDKEDIYVSSAGDVYVNYKSEGKVKNLKSNNITKYEGTFIEMSDAGVFSDNSGKLNKSAYK